MPWTDDSGPRPQRSEHELFEEVQQRAGAIRRRRRAVVGAALGGMAAIVILVAGLARAGDDPTSEVHVVGPPPTTSTSIVVTTLAPAPLPTTTVPAPTTTRAPATSTTRRPATSTSTSTTVPAALRQCEAADVVVTAAPERPTYARTEQIPVVATAVNRSSRPCQEPSYKSLEFFDSAGRSAGGISLSSTPAFDDVAARTWAPGETLRGNLPGWLSCSDQPCPPGTYTAVMSFGPFKSPPTTFSVT